MLGFTSLGWEAFCDKVCIIGGSSYKSKGCSLTNYASSVGSRLVVSPKPFILGEYLELIPDIKLLKNSLRLALIKLSCSLS